MAPRVEKETKGEILMEVNRSPVLTTQSLVKPRSNTGIYFDMVPNTGRGFPRKPVFGQIALPGDTYWGVVRLYMAPLDTSHALL